MSVATTETPPVVLPAVIAEDKLYEVVNGQYVELPPMGAYEGTLANFLCHLMAQVSQAHNLGRCVVEILFLLDSATNLKRRPDVAFVSYERWAKGRTVPEGDAWEVVPNLAIEVVSPNNTAKEYVGKVQEYFRAGVQRVWVIYPGVEQVYVYSSPTDIRVLTRPDVLEGEPLLPGFRLPVTTLFEGDTAT